MLATLQGSPMANPESLKDKTWGKHLICKQAGHLAKECPNHDKSPKMVCYTCRQLEDWVALCPQDPRASRSRAKPSLMMIQQDWSRPLQPAHLTQKPSWDWSQRWNWMWHIGLRISWLTQGLPTLSWLPSPEPSYHKPVPFWVLKEKQLQKDSPQLFFVAWMENIFQPVSGGSWVSYSLIEKRYTH